MCSSLSTSEPPHHDWAAGYMYLRWGAERFLGRRTRGAPARRPICSAGSRIELNADAGDCLKERVGQWERSVHAVTNAAGSDSIAAIASAYAGLGLRSLSHLITWGDSTVSRGTT